MKKIRVYKAFITVERSRYEDNKFYYVIQWLDLNFKWHIEPYTSDFSYAEKSLKEKFEIIKDEIKLNDFDFLNYKFIVTSARICRKQYDENQYLYYIEYTKPFDEYTYTNFYGEYDYVIKILKEKFYIISNPEEENKQQKI